MSVQATSAVQKHARTFVKAHSPASPLLAEVFPIIRLAYPNVLISGPEGQTEWTLLQMRPYLRPPLATWVPRENQRAPVGVFRSLLVRGVDSLDASQQEDLIALINRSWGAVQIISIANAPLFPLVTSGAFLQSLYYKLNMVLLEPAGDWTATRGVPLSIDASSDRERS
jgi:hypothetical protein